ncbi:MAG: protein phosphatase 2C domain-containing protein [Anaerolineaceae bacterium]|jgi:protein phosphatase
MKRIAQAHLPVVALTHPGMKGKNNEDRYAVSAFQLSTYKVVPVLLALLCDGIGGHRAGEVAAEMAVNRISQRIAESDGSHPAHIIEEAVKEASREIYARAQSNFNQRGMGSTMACVWIIGRRLFTATIGDSRVYLLRHGLIHQLSTDHTWIQEALTSGLITPAQVKGHPNAHVIRRYLGSPAPPRVDIRLHLTGTEDDAHAEANQGTLLEPGDILVLCTDGLSDLVEGREILAAYREQPMDAAGQALIDLANERGGLDNITLISIAVPAPAPQPAKASFPWRLTTVSCATLALLAVLVLGLGAGWAWLSQRATSTPLPTGAATQAVLLFKPSATLIQISPTSFPTRMPSSTATIPLLPADTGPTLTAWPTSTLAPSATMTVTLTQLTTPTKTLPAK